MRLPFYRRPFVKRSVIVVLALLAVTGCNSAQAQHREMVMAHGAQVMPFDQKVTMHMFTPTGNGGSVEVMVHNNDPKQIALVREHLRMEAARFAKGEYSDPAYIHGSDMPGLSTLESRPHDVSVRYENASTGGIITLASVDPEMVSAIHKWLAAQQADHGTSMSRMNI
jgi:hypothetical protein